MRYMKIIPGISAFLLFWILLAVSAAQAAVAPTGRWKTIDDESGKVNSIVEIWVENGMLFGKVVEIIHWRTKRRLKSFCKNSLASG